MRSKSQRANSAAAPASASPTTPEPKWATGSAAELCVPEEPEALPVEDAEPVEVAPSVGVAEVVGYAAPKALISKESEVA